MKKPTIYDIKYATQEKQPYYFSRETMRFFGQTMRDFSVIKSINDRIFIIAKTKHNNTSVREFIDNDLKHVNIPSVYKHYYQIESYLKTL